MTSVSSFSIDPCSIAYKLVFELKGAPLGNGLEFSGKAFFFFSFIVLTLGEFKLYDVN